MRRSPARRADGDPDLRALRDADAEYHRLCVEIQEPDVSADRLPLDELASATAELTAAIERLRTRP